jgi:uncharacterized protein
MDSRRSASSRVVSVLTRGTVPCDACGRVGYTASWRGWPSPARSTLAYASLVERNLFTLRRFDVPMLPPDTERLRVLHLSDLHLTPPQRRKQRWVADPAGLDPDLVVATGDNIAHPDAAGR